MSLDKIILRVSEDEPSVGYLYLPNHPGPGKHGVVVKQICLSDLIENHDGPVIYFDLDKSGSVIGIEVT